jgi:nicotinamide mononucleotide transporter
MSVYSWITNNYIEVFGVLTGVIYVFLEIRQSTWLWPVGILTSAVYIWIFFTSKIYADMSLQVYYLVISILGWYWWVRGSEHRALGSGQISDVHLNDTPFRGKGVKESGGEGCAQRKGRNEDVTELRAQSTEQKGEKEKGELQVTRLKPRTGIILALVFVLLYIAMYLVLTRLTDSPVPVRDAFITSLSIVATWMLARKIYEHWYLWIVVNFVSAVLFMTRGLYPTVILYLVYGIMSFVGLAAWKKTIRYSDKSKI